MFVFVCLLFELETFLLKTLRQNSHISLSLPTLSNFKLFSQKLSFFNLNLRTLNLLHSSMAESSLNQETSMQVNYGKLYIFKPKTMVLGKEDLIVQIESLVDFQALKRHGVDIIDYMMTQEMDGYFRILNGPIYEELVKDFWIGAEVYNKEATKMEEFKKIDGDESLKGKTIAEMGLQGQKLGLL